MTISKDSLTNVPHYTIIRDEKGKPRLKFSGDNWDSSMATVLDRYKDLLLIRTPGHRYAPGLIAEYFKPNYEIIKLLQGDFDSKFSYVSKECLEYSLHTKKETRKKIIKLWKEVMK